MGMASSDDEKEIAREYEIRKKVGELYDVLRQRPSQYDGGRPQSEDEQAIQGHNEGKKMEELRELLEKQEWDYWGNDRR